MQYQFIHLRLLKILHFWIGYYAAEQGFARRMSYWFDLIMLVIYSALPTNLSGMNLNAVRRPPG